MQFSIPSNHMGLISAALDALTDEDLKRPVFNQMFPQGLDNGSPGAYAKGVTEVINAMRAKNYAAIPRSTEGVLATTWDFGPAEMGVIVTALAYLSEVHADAGEEMFEQVNSDLRAQAADDQEYASEVGRSVYMVGAIITLNEIIESLEGIETETDDNV